MSDFPTSTQLGNHVVIEEDVKIGENVLIGHNTTILKGTIIGDGVTIGNNCVLGIQPAVNPRMRKTSNADAQLIIQSGAKIGHIASIYSGTQIGENVFIGDHASIRENVSVGEESVVGRAAIVEVNSRIGKGCTIQTLAYVTGDTILEDEVFIGPCVSMSNDKYMGAQQYALKGPHIKEGAKIGNNASLLPSVTVGKNSIVGAGAVVTRNIGEHVTAAGIPARELNS